MLNLRISVLVIYLLVAGGVGAGSMFMILNNSTASADATAVIDCKAPERSAEPSRHVQPVNSGRDKEY